MGVFLQPLTSRILRKRLPHARGGVSTTPKCIFPCWWSSPRSWGCFRFIRQLHRPQPGLPHARGGVSLVAMALDTGQPVFPTLVGVFPRTGIILIRGTGSSPRSWGCFHMTELTIYYTSSLPHARGGVSGDVKSTDTILGSSPRSWGCFQKQVKSRRFRKVFPTLVGVFPYVLYCAWACCRSSPRSWGCFHPYRWLTGVKSVFPTLVGVFNPTTQPHTTRWRLPHARGGVSITTANLWGLFSSSPRSWGCFLRAQSQADVEGVFPTLVGVFP